MKPCLCNGYRVITLDPRYNTPCPQCNPILGHAYQAKDIGRKTIDDESGVPVMFADTLVEVP